MKTLSLDDSTGVGLDSDNKAYYIVDSFDIYTTGEATNLKITNVEVANAAANIDQSLRILVVCDKTKFVIAPNKTDATTTYTVGVDPDGTTNAGTEATAYGSAASGGYSDQVVAATVSGNDAVPTTVEVYVYYEGEDTNHFTDNFEDNSLAVTLTFEATVTAA